mgnify:FL=1
MQRDHELNITVRSGGGIDVKVVYRDKVPDLLAGFSEEARRRARRWSWMPTADERRLWRATRGMPRWARETVRQHILRERAERIEAKLRDKAERAAERQAQRQARMEAVREAVAQRSPEQALGEPSRAVEREVVRDLPELRETVPALLPSDRIDLPFELPVIERPQLAAPDAEARELVTPEPMSLTQALELPKVWADRYGSDSLTARLGAGLALSSVGLPELSLTERIAEGHAVPLAVPPKVIRHHGRER